MSDRFRVVIVGGGVAGMAIATRLGNSLGRSGKLDITLVDKGFSHVWKPMLHCFAAGTARNENDRITFISHAAAHGFRFCYGEIAGIDRAAKRLKLAPLEEEDHEVLLDERYLDYDVLIFAIGSRANDFGTPGVVENCIFLDNIVEANNFNERFRHAVIQAYGRGSPLDIAIVGGGATGVQLAAELHKALDIGSLYNFTPVTPEMRVTLLEAGPRILPAFPKNVSAAAQKQLEALKIKVLTSTMVSGADEHGFMLKDGTRVDAQFRVWAAGVKAPDVTRQMDGLECGRGGQFLVRPNLQTTLDDSIFAVGDCAFISDSPLAPTAQVARQQAHHLARYLPGFIFNKKPVPAFKFRNRGAIVALGDYNGWGAFADGKTFGGGFMHGLSARLGHMALYRQHQFELYGPFRGMIACFTDWLDGFVRPPVRMD
ncbi:MULTISPECIES: NAD(P)/FAD-dependent oxidoreductase [Acetobacter]|uniref:NAD(P)/FAD-dependent oxidoreductase n=2 Tax=Acetobacter TaxID=434 RepID=A0AAN1PIN2_9PROT|nr:MULTISPECIES: NAD(P)/FAD-dependent oxidoreductase [Acetobacter]ANA13184.1 pyridine nucleotide-disulfide oxidoreductase [Acetobacter oryzifermentans]ASL39583.1 FAD-dependent oxidoreductase [Acetobacter oryzifermentans]AXN00989.1 NAD(P)/FAD-dependent oxidoreductase [Acetobacter pomorum]KAA8398613.1 NAD(P)/FAD-dependent oxidoreductase [Acetobacter sp. DmW_125127]KAA8399147.1 NAD(P)/FAD-dependent oxidoreductase [Acetobacter sp. DmW_125128]